MKWLALALSVACCAAQPVITDLQPRGAQKGRPFTLTLIGRYLGEGAKITSTMPASFTPLAPEKTMGMDEGRSASFLVEPSSELAVGVYPIRVETPEGISNIQLLAVGSFPEYVEDESRPGALPNSNDTIETAQPLPSAPITINGKLRGPERDFYRTFAKAGEKRVFEVEARRCGSAIDPVIELLDGSGKVLARSEDAVLLGLDARLEYTFAREGNYYVSVHDARYSTQSANFYRLKTGAYGYPQDVFPLGGQRGRSVPVSLGGEAISVDLRNTASARVAFVNVRDSAALPVPFAIGDDPEITEPVTSAVTLPVTINGRISKPGEVDRYPLQVTPGEWLTFRVQARELETSKLMAVIAVFDGKGKKLGQAGDEPMAEDVYNVNQSRTAGDPELRLQVPPDVTSVAVTIEDLALRGGPHYAYRLNVRKSEQDIRVVLNTPYVNIPAGGSVAVPVAVERHGYDGDVELRVPNAPKGLRVEGGHVISPGPMKENNRIRNSPGVLVLTAEPGTVLPPVELDGGGRWRTTGATGRGSGDDGGCHRRNSAGIGGPAASGDGAVARTGTAGGGDSGAGGDAGRHDDGSQAHDGRRRASVPLEVDASRRHDACSEEGEPGPGGRRRHSGHRHEGGWR